LDLSTGNSTISAPLILFESCISEQFSSIIVTSGTLSWVRTLSC